MQESTTFDETDRALVHALQIAPRASWHLVGRVLGISPVTAARRWQRLVGEGLAWVTCLPGPALLAEQILAFVEIECEAAAVPGVVDTLADDPRVASIEVTTGRTDLVLTVFCADLATLTGFVLRGIAQLDGVHATRTHLGTGIYAEGAGWRLDALTPAQQRRLGNGIPTRPGGAVPVRTIRELLLACAADGRRSAAELAQVTATSPSTVRRRLARMMRDRAVTFRCEVAIGVSGWPISITYWATVPPDLLEHVARTLATVPEVRLCAAVTGGGSNLVLTAWLRSLGDSQLFEASVADRFSGLVIDDRAVAVRIPKRIGWRLDDVGRATGAVLIDPWHAEP